MMGGGGHLMWSSIYGPNKPTSGKRVDWKRIGALFLPYWKHLTLVLICIYLVQIIGLIPAYVGAKIIDDAFPHRDYPLLVKFVGLIFGSALVAAAIGVAQGYVNSIVGESIMRDMRTSLVAHLHKMPLSFFTGTKTGEIMNRVSSDVDNIDNVVTGTLTAIIQNVVTIVVTLGFMFAWNPKLALISVVIVPFMVAPLNSVGRRMYDIRKKTREQRDQIESITQETLSVSGIALIKSFARESYEKTRFYGVGTKLMGLEIKLASVGRWFMASIGATVTIGPAIVWLVGGWIAFHGDKNITVGLMTAFIGLIAAKLYGPAAALAGVQVQIVSALAVFERIFEYLDNETEEYVPKDAVALPNVDGDVRFDDVHFSYSPDREILRGVTLHVAPGQIAAFVGPSGAGKSTITQLVPRFYDPQSGAISIDGHDVRTVTLESLRRDIGIVSQETYLFHDTIAANLRYAKVDATDDELRDASRKANIDEFIIGLTDGYETIVGERGHKLSGGERQRLAIARVLLKDPRILILDEATSALDSENEAAIQAALEIAMRGRTSLVIAHRLSTVQNADIIFVVDEGRIVESGTHAELISRPGLYARLYRTQFRELPASS